MTKATLTLSPKGSGTATGGGCGDTREMTQATAALGVSVRQIKRLVVATGKTGRVVTDEYESDGAQHVSVTTARPAQQLSSRGGAA